MNTAPAARLRGGAVGVVTAATAVAAHAMAGGGYPGNSGATFLLIVALAVGALAGLGSTSRRSIGVLFGGQLVAHVALGVSAAGDMTGPMNHHLVPSAAMLGFHAVASMVAGLLITGAERLYGPITSVVRAVLLVLAPLPESLRTESHSVPPGLRSLDLLLPISRRGPPVCAF